MTDGESEKNCFHFSKKAINLSNVISEDTGTQ